MVPRRIVSGGQTGVDRAALDWAIDHGIEHGGWCPAGRRAEDGTIPARYALTEHRGASYRHRTRENVRQSDATLILNVGVLDGGTALTRAFAQSEHKPCCVIDLDAEALDDAASAVVEWLRDCRPVVLNVAGPRESKRPGVNRLARKVLDLCAAKLGLSSQGARGTVPATRA